MRISSVHAHAVTRPEALGRPSPRPSDTVWSEHANPLGLDPAWSARASELAPPWPEAICVVTAADGTFGVGMTSAAGLVVPTIDDYLAPLVVGTDAADVESNWGRLARVVDAHLGGGGVASRALSAIDLALWDLRGKLDGEAVVARLGSATATGRRCYLTTRHPDLAAAWGFHGVKLPMPWERDREASIDSLRRSHGEARATLGPHVAIMLDAWAVMDRSDATAIGVVAHELGVAWLEDCLHPSDVAGHRLVEAAVPGLRTAAGERWFSIESFANALELGAPHVLQPDVQWVGGATPTVRIAELAASAGATLSIHCGANDAYGQHLAAGLPHDDVVELYSEGPEPERLPHWRSTPGMADPSSGSFTPSEAPGFGVELTMTDIERATRG